MTKWINWHEQMNLAPSVPARKGRQPDKLFAPDFLWLKAIKSGLKSELQELNFKCHTAYDRELANQSTSSPNSQRL